MPKDIYNGRTECIRRVYGTLKYFVGENFLYKRGDLLYVSTKNNEDYDLILEADGVKRFIELYNDRLKPKPDVQPGPDTVGSDEIINGSVSMDDLNASVRARLVEPEILQEITELLSKTVVVDE
jgi:hypothetical protein